MSLIIFSLSALKCRNENRMTEIEVQWFDPNEIPTERNEKQPIFSVDVLIYSESTKERTVGWFDFKEIKWSFLCRESQKKWKWRYFNDKIDK